ncbi:hypothetical protein IW262DRAFT_1461704 [Armillaria fumosa]|nr:hypothetical protein IW262DRAFT_1461704 [Armillaria fumosa]
MLWQNQISAVQNFKLGYNRGTTPIICIFFVGLTILLVFINIPLSAYDVVQEFTYNPNDTSPSLSFTNIIPAPLRHTAGDFTPQTFRVGDTIQIESSVFTVVIVKAMASGKFLYGTAVGSFPYYNNPLSSCNVFYERKSQSRFPSEDPILFDLDGILMDLEYGWNSENVTLISKIEGESAPTTTRNFNESYIVGVHSQYDPFLKDHPSCDDDVAKFQGTEMVVYYGQDGSFSYMNIPPGGNILPSDQDLDVPSNVQLLLQNALQAIYSIVRIDLGVSSPNQIFASSIMFSKSISSVSLFEPWTDDTNPPLCDIGASASIIVEEERKTFVVNDSYANCIRRGTCRVVSSTSVPPKSYVISHV